MPKRLFWFLVSLAVVVGFNILAPVLERQSAISRSENTSLSVRPAGYKALYLLLQRLEPQPAALWQHSMMNLKTDAPHAIWLVEPGDGLFFDGARYAAHMRELVERGNHVVFAISSNTPHGLTATLDSINTWYGLSLKTHRLQMARQNLSVISHFPSRNIQVLDFIPQAPASSKTREGLTHYRHQNYQSLLAFQPESVRNGQVLLTTWQGNPLIARFPLGKGSVTVVLNSFYLGNAQLNQADNAALAIALQEINGHSPALFEVYSSGFNENRDIVTYLATGKGIALLMTLMLLLVAFCVWILWQPLKTRHYSKRSQENYFTQEIFIDSLATHYMSTGNWSALYGKLAEQFKRQIERKYPGLPFEAQLERIGQNPFYSVSPESLKAVFAMMRIPSESDFIAKSQRLLDIQRKVNRHEQQSESRTRYRSTSA